jgi:hypothetical protein
LTYSPEGTLILCNGVPKRFTPHPSERSTRDYPVKGDYVCHSVMAYTAERS